MKIFKPISESKAKGKVKRIFDDIKKIRNIKKIPNFWRSIAHNTETLERTWNNLKQIMGKGTLDPVTKENSLQVLLGSHKFPKLVRPTKWSNDKPWYKDNDNFMDMPDITKIEKNILSSEMNIGDAILFNFKVLHSSSGNTEKIPRRAFSMRFIGDDVKYIDRGGETSPPFKGIDLNNGAKMREDWFPVIWRN